MKTYEAMFLFDPTFAAESGNVEQEVARLMQRANAEVIMSDRWDERKLAYEIKGRKRGCYVLTFFKAEAERIVGLERDVQLSDQVLRVLVLRADELTEEDMKRAYLTRGGESAGPHGEGPEDHEAHGREMGPRRGGRRRTGPTGTAVAEAPREAAAAPEAKADVPLDEDDKPDQPE